MSLDVYLREPGRTVPVTPQGSGIFIRRDGATVEISREEWELRNPGVPPVHLSMPDDPAEVFHANITHNLVPMAKAAGVYDELWRPYRLLAGYRDVRDGITSEYDFEDSVEIKAGMLIGGLRNGLHMLKLRPSTFTPLNPPNGWGTYDGLVKFVQNYLDACYLYQDAIVIVSR